MSARLLSVAAPPKVFIAGSGDAAGKWLVLGLEFTPAKEGESLEINQISILDASSAEQKVAAIDGARKVGDRNWFLRIGDVPGVLEGWAALREKGGAYFGAMYIGPKDERMFILSKAGRLILQKQGPIKMFLLFSKPGGPKPYKLKIGDKFQFPLVLRR
jgi:hypothetical protein